MLLAGWHMIAAIVVVAAVGGLSFWLLARLLVVIADVWPRTLPFAMNMLAGAGHREYVRYRATGRALAAVTGAALTALLSGTLAALLLRNLPAPGLAKWLWMLLLIVSVAVVGGGIFLTVRLVMKRRSLRFAWAAKAAIGSVLKRLNLAGNSIYHDVVVDGAVIDHVLVGRQGVFALNVVARPVPKKNANRPGAELKNGKLSLGGDVEVLPVGDAARNMTLLCAALSRVVGHRVPVRSVLVVPGWHTVASDSGNHLVLNENNLSMLTSWNTPDAYLMDEDCVAIQTFLHESGRAARID